MNTWRTIRWLLLASVLPVPVWAQSVPQREPLFLHVPEAALKSPATHAKHATSVMLSEPAGGAIDRWERFHAEFGIRKHSSGMVKGPLQKAKFQLDQALFGVKDFVEHDLQFDYAIGTATTGANEPRRSRDNRWLDAWENARLKSDISISPETKLFVGVKLVLPISD